MTTPRDPTRFTRESAERIANVVRAAELGYQQARPLVFDKADDPPSRKVFRIATFTGNWPIGTDKIVTLKYVTPPSTANVTNLFFPLVPGPNGIKDCAIAKDGTSWFLIDVPFTTATVVAVQSVTQQNVVSDVQISAVLNTSNCVITVSRTNTTASITVVSSTATATVVRF